MPFSKRAIKRCAGALTLSSAPRYLRLPGRVSGERETGGSTDNKEACPVHRPLPLLLQPVRNILCKKGFVFDFTAVLHH
jgi:hypothetical protein